MPTLTWQAVYDNQEPKTQQESDRERILELRDILDVDYESNYSLEELEEMLEERCDGEE